MREARTTSYGLPVKTRRIIAYVVLIILTIMCLFWFYLMFINSTRNSSQIQKGISFIPGASFFKNFKNVANNSSQPIIKALLNSFVIAVLNMAICVYFSTMTAYAIHVYDFKGRATIFTGILMIMMIPSQVTVLGLLQWIEKLQLFNKTVASIFGSGSLIYKIAKGGTAADYIWLILPGIASPITFYYLKQYMESALPLSLVESARIDGSSEFRTFNEIALPLMKPALAVEGIFCFVGSWNNYFVPSHVLANVDTQLKTVPIIIALLRTADYAKFDMGQVYMSIFVAIFPVIVVYLVLSKHIVGGLALGAVKG